MRKSHRWTDLLHFFMPACHLLQTAMHAHLRYQIGACFMTFMTLQRDRMNSHTLLRLSGFVLHSNTICECMPFLSEWHVARQGVSIGP